jgi:hypothetical protein
MSDKIELLISELADSWSASSNPNRMLTGATERLRLLQAVLPHPSCVISAPARRRAIKEVKAALQRQGRKLSQMPRREMVAIADDYFVQHRQAILEQTWAWVRSSPELLALYEKEQRARAKRSAVQRAKP